MRKIVLFFREPALAAVVVLGAACSSSSESPPDGGAGDADGGAMGTTPDGAASKSSASDAGIGFAPSNVPLPSIPAGLGDVQISAAGCTIDTDALTIDCISRASDGGLPYAFATAGQSDGSTIAVLSAGSFTIAAAGSLSMRGGVPLVILARTTVNIQGAFIADPAFHPTNGGGAVPTPSGAGGGPGGGLAGTSNPQIGASGGGYCGTGGAGGNSQTVVADAGAPLPGGRSYGNPAIEPLVGGSAGGAVPGVGGGGEGGGAIEIAAGQSILVGAGGVVSVPGYGGTGNGGGGGSGGAILLEAPSVTVNGVLAANGGGGAVFGGGGGAQDGQASDRPAMGEDANSAVGSAGSQIGGADGMATTLDTSSGGGGAGRIRINTTTGMATIGAAATLSPSLATSCATQGVLAN